MNLKTLLYSLILFCSITGFANQEKNNNLKIYDLRCEMLTNPQGIDVLTPKLSWKIQGEAHGLNQIAYRILAASSLEKLNNEDADLWDSGKQNSASSISVVYNGDKLSSNQDIYWKVKVWTNDNESTWSSPAHWSMGLLNFNDW